MIKTRTLSDFMSMDIVRDGDDAYIVFDYYEGHPVLLIGFVESSELSDFEIREEGFGYYQLLMGALV